MKRGTCSYAVKEQCERTLGLSHLPVVNAKRPQIEYMYTWTDKSQCIPKSKTQQGEVNIINKSSYLKFMKQKLISGLLRYFTHRMGFDW